MSSDAAAPPPIDDDLVAEVERLAEALAVRGHHADLAARLEWLVDVLIQRGQLAPGHRRILGKLRGAETNVKLALFREKRALVGPEIDCASRLSICRAACCRFTVTLSSEDLTEGKLRWMVHDPYLLPRSPQSGYCMYCQDGGGCTVYDDRPGACRAYDCRHDSRVWEDFEQRIPAAGLHDE